jgi:phage baseplate assembly protein W
MTVQIALPFSFNASGSVNVTNADEKVWSDRVITAVMTRIGERVMRPKYGSNVVATIFENESEASSIVRREVPAIFATWLPELTLLAVTAKIENNELADNTLAISIEYLLPNKQKGITTTRVHLGTFTQTGLLIEEIQ